MKSYEVFEGRYIVNIGSRGKVTVISNIDNGVELKVYGKRKDSLRYVNMTAYKGSDRLAYSVEDLKHHCLEGTKLEPLSENELLSLLNKTRPPMILNNPVEIEQLEQSFDKFHNLCFIEEVEGYTRYYSKVDFVRKSNGLLKYNYKVVTTCKETKTSTNNVTLTFSYPEKMLINDISSVPTEDLESILKLINKEQLRRKNVGISR